MRLAVAPVSQAAVAYTSVSIAVITFTVVFFCHTYKQVWPKLHQKIHQLRHSERREIFEDCSSDEEAGVDFEPHSAIAPTMTVIERPSPEPLDLIHESSSMPLSIANLIEFQEGHDLNPGNNNSQKTQPLIPPTMNFTELREPLNLIDTDN